MAGTLQDAGDERDVLVFGQVTFLYNGLRSSASSWLKVVHDNPATVSTDVVAFVTDCFDRHLSRPTLHDILRKLPIKGTTTDALAISSVAVDLRRLVDEYRRSPDGSSWALAQSDVELYHYITRTLDLRCAIYDDVRDRSCIEPRQRTNHVILMVAPTEFGFNPLAAEDNLFSQLPTMEADQVRDQAMAEFGSLYRALIEHGVDISLICDSSYTATPDAVFPNNWFSTHPPQEIPDGRSTLVLYPIKPISRRAERRPDIIRKIRSVRSFGRVLDLTPYESDEAKQYLEGTGSMVLDRVNRVCFMSRSERSNASLAKHWCDQLGYRLMSFAATDINGAPVYHTNVLMAIGTKVAVICLEAIEDPAERKVISDALTATHEIIDITRRQMSEFCGNVIELENGLGRPILVMSSRAYYGFTIPQRESLLHHVDSLVHEPIPTIEGVGGGGVRCTIAELF